MKWKAQQLETYASSWCTNGLKFNLSRVWPDCGNGLTHRQTNGQSFRVLWGLNSSKKDWLANIKEVLKLFPFMSVVFWNTRLNLMDSQTVLKRKKNVLFKDFLLRVKSTYLSSRFSLSVALLILCRNVESEMGFLCSKAAADFYICEVGEKNNCKDENVFQTLWS